jgi:hypothetical protein
MNSGDSSNGGKRLPVSSLEMIIRDAAPDALLVDSRLIRRVIRLDRRLPGMGLRVPHVKTYIIERARLLALVDRKELEPVTELPPVTILLGRPPEKVDLNGGSFEDLLWQYWRLLFHARVHLEIENRFSNVEERQTIASMRRQQLGELKFAEIRSVLLQDGFLFEEHTDWDVYAEFAAVSLECKYFAPEELKFLFPAITDWVAVEDLLSQDVQHAELYEVSRLVLPTSEPTDVGHNPLGIPRQPSGLTRSRVVTIPRGDSNKWQARALRSSQVGNHLKAAICWNLAANSSSGENVARLRESGQAELKILVDKLRTALGQDESSIEEWLTGLSSVLDLATTSFWSAEARMLYDLQKICAEFEAESCRANLFGWLVSFGREPLTRSMPLLKYVLMATHIRSAQRRMGKTRLGNPELIRVKALLEHAEELAESLLRETIRPLINHQLDQVYLMPENVPERVARKKLVEEMLDNLVEYGSLTSSNFRDALSKGDLKLRDVSGRELLIGDQFLLADRGLATPLDGIYRPAPIYMRWSQRLSSLAFGTGLGRFFTMHLALPFGGAFLTVEGVRHVIALFFGKGHPSTSKPGEQAIDLALTTQQVAQDLHSSSHGQSYTTALVLATGLLIHLLMHRPRFRAACIGLCNLAMRGVRKILIEWPARLLRIRLIEQLLYGPLFAPLRTYLIKPGVLTGFLLFVLQPIVPGIDLRNALLIFLSIALVLNSQIGRYADEWITDLLWRAVEDLRARVFGVVFQWIMDVFQRLLAGLDRILHTLDEWSRFRTRDSQIVKTGKFITGSLWAVIAYFVVLVSTLLIEPQINPIKHFPVVTVSHKLLLPMGPFFVGRLTPFIGTAKANTLVWSTIWLIPGIFGFLVWELRGNWRLYAANRPQVLQPQAVGHHGETMVALLRPTFHSGTLPKLFARLRNAVRRQNEPAGKKQLNRWQAVLKINQRRVQCFVERELLELLKQSETFEPMLLSVHSVRLATNRVQVALWNATIADSFLWIVWEECHGQLVAYVQDHQLLAHLLPLQRDQLALALSGLFQRTGVEQVNGNIGNTHGQRIAWDSWVSLWNS